MSGLIEVLRRAMKKTVVMIGPRTEESPINRMQAYGSNQRKGWSNVLRK